MNNERNAIRLMTHLRLSKASDITYLAQSSDSSHLKQLTIPNLILTGQVWIAGTLPTISQYLTLGQVPSYKSQKIHASPEKNTWFPKK